MQISHISATEAKQEYIAIIISILINNEMKMSCLSAFTAVITTFSCQDKKKFTEVVEVPLPTAQEKVSIG
jgi:hypothetical protein